MGLTGSLLFTLNQSVTNSLVREAFFLMTVTPDVFVPELVTMRLSGATATGDGLVLGLGELCPAGFFGSLCMGPSSSMITSANSFSSTPSAFAVSELSSFQLTQNYIVDAGPAGSASLTSVQLTFTSVPEPGTAISLAIGLAAVCILRRRHGH
jgi:hypothetical protein